VSLAVYFYNSFKALKKLVYLNVLGSSPVKVHQLEDKQFQFILAWLSMFYLVQPIKHHTELFQD